MFDNFRKTEQDILDIPAHKLVAEMAAYSPGDPEFEAALDRLERVYALKGKESPKRVSPDTMAIVLGNLAGIFIIVAYEQKHVLTSKGMNLILKPK